MPLKVVQTDHVPESRKANRGEVSEFFGVAPNSVEAWVRRGCPYLVRGERGAPWVFDLLAVARWRFGGAEETASDDPEKMSPKDRLDWYKGTKERLALGQLRGELVLVSDVTEAWIGQVAVAKGRLLALPSRLAPDMVRCTDMREAERTIKSALMTILEELAGGQPAD